MDFDVDPDKFQQLVDEDERLYEETYKPILEQLGWLDPKTWEE